MHELIPVTLGFLLGAAAVTLRPAVRLPIVAFAALGFGLFATSITGEAAITWKFALVDIPTVTLAALVGMTLRRHVSVAGRERGTRRP